MIEGLNLLPPKTKEEVVVEERFDTWRPALGLFFGVAVALLLLVLGARFVLDRHDAELARILNAKVATGASGVSEVSKSTTRVNQKISLLQSAVPQRKNWEADLKRVLALIPANIKLGKVEVTDVGQLTISGTADTRSSFLQLQTVLTASSFLEQVKTADTASKREDLPFTYTAIIRSSE